jgi:putative PIN family toxin of toxin-antitoxin system
MSGLFWQGTPARVLAAWRDGHFALLLSPQIYAEYERVAEELRTSRPSVDPRAFLQLVLSKGLMIEAQELGCTVCSDPDDDKFIACALAGQADFLVTGDKALLAASGHGGLRIVTPASFLKEHRG